MTAPEYLSHVRQHLRVSAQQQEEIIAELSEHCSSLSNKRDIVSQLGEPKRLARSYNRIYLGWFHTPLRMYGVPLIIAALSYMANFITTFTVRYESFAYIERLSIATSLCFMLIWILIYTQLFTMARSMHGPRFHMLMVFMLLAVTVGLPELVSGLAPFQSQEMVVIVAASMRVAIITTVSLLSVAVGLSIKKMKQRLG